jgi:cellulose synthase/poly-beta-1,6-N-acetylglucosamine synthase-like glycosyltransferase
MPGTVAGSAGWAANASERMPILADASGWYVEPPSFVLKSRSAASVSLTMIVKNEQENLPRYLASVVGIFDEIIIVDTGSTDRTKEIARELGAKVFDFA